MPADINPGLEPKKKKKSALKYVIYILIVLIATGKNKAKAIYDLLKGPKTEAVPCSILQDHPDCTIYVDEAAYSLVK